MAKPKVHWKRSYGRPGCGQVNYLDISLTTDKDKVTCRKCLRMLDWMHG